MEILDRLDKQLRRLHDFGYVFIDLSPTNVLVDDDDQVRLIDFEAVQPIAEVRRIMGTPGTSIRRRSTLADGTPTNSTGTGWPRWP